MTPRTLARLLPIALSLALLRPLYAGARGEPSATLAAAQRAMNELRYDDARAELDSALKRGHHGREELIALHALRAEVAAVVDGRSAGEAEFRKLLVLMPDHQPPARGTPVMNVPFQLARRWVNDHGHLEAEVRIAGTPRPNTPTTLTVALVSDPLAMVEGVRLFHRESAAAPFVLASATTLRQTLPALSPSGVVEYYLELVSGNDDVVFRLGSSDAPLTLQLPDATRPIAARGQATRLSLIETQRAPAPDRPRIRNLALAGYIIGGFGAVSLASSIGVDVTGKQQYDDMLHGCAPTCSDASVAQLRQYEGAAIGLYTTAGVTLVASAILLVVDRVRR
jgi:hypothetical protein